MVTFVWRRQWQPPKVAVGSGHGYFCVAPAVAAVSSSCRESTWLSFVAPEVAAV